MKTDHSDGHVMVSGVDVGTAAGGLFLAGVGLWALLTGLRLHAQRPRGMPATLLAIRLIGSAVLVGAAVLLEDVLGAAMGTWLDLVLLMVVVAGIAVAVLDVSFLVSYPRPLRPVERRPWLRWLPLALPAIMLVFLLVGWPGQPPMQVQEIPAGDTEAWSIWSLWFDRYDIVEDTVISALFGTLALSILALAGIHGGRGLFGDADEARVRSRRLVALAAWPPIGWALAAGLVMLFSMAMPPGGFIVLEGLQAFLLSGQVGFSLLLLVPTLWARDLLARDGTGEIGTAKPVGADPAPETGQAAGP